MKKDNLDFGTKKQKQKTNRDKRGRNFFENDMNLESIDVIKSRKLKIILIV